MTDLIQGTGHSTTIPVSVEAGLYLTRCTNGCIQGCCEGNPAFCQHFRGVVPYHAISRLSRTERTTAGMFSSIRGGHAS